MPLRASQCSKRRVRLAKIFMKSPHFRWHYLRRRFPGMLVPTWFTQYLCLYYNLHFARMPVAHPLPRPASRYRWWAIDNIVECWIRSIKPPVDTRELNYLRLFRGIRHRGFDDTCDVIWCHQNAARAILTFIKMPRFLSYWRMMRCASGFQASHQTQCDIIDG